MKNYHLHNRPNREISSQSEISEILVNGKFAVISMCFENEPYIVTLSYGYDKSNNIMFFHCSKQGLKLSFIQKNPSVCATVIDDGGYIHNECGHNYKSVVFWGDMKVVTDIAEKRYGMKILLQHLEKQPDVMNNKLANSEMNYDNMEILKLQIIQIHGKEGR